MQILVLLGMYFDAVVAFVTSQTLLFRLALAILCYPNIYCVILNFFLQIKKSSRKVCRLNVPT